MYEIRISQSIFSIKIAQENYSKIADVIETHFEYLKADVLKVL